jgi:hypothetical protein
MSMTSAMAEQGQQPQPPAEPAEVRRNISGVRQSDVLAVLGAATASLSLTMLVFTHIAPFSGKVGFVVFAFAAFLSIYALLVALDEDGPAVRARVVSALIHGVAALLMLTLVFIVGFTLWRGLEALRHLNFFAEDLADAGPLEPLEVGGIIHAAVGTLIMISIALAITVPLGLVCAVFLNEIPGALARLVRTIVEAMTALPSIVAGLFIYATAILILGLDRSGLAGSARAQRDDAADHHPGGRRGDPAGARVLAGGVAGAGHGAVAHSLACRLADRPVRADHGGDPRHRPRHRGDVAGAADSSSRTGLSTSRCRRFPTAWRTPASASPTQPRRGHSRICRSLLGARRSCTT